MKVSEQIDALHSVGRDPVEVVATSRVSAMIISMPLLVSLANLVGSARENIRLRDRSLAGVGADS